MKRCEKCLHTVLQVDSLGERCTKCGHRQGTLEQPGRWVGPQEIAALVASQKPPQANGSPAVWDMVIADVSKRGYPDSLIEAMSERDKIGRERYGTPLQPGNGRDALIDAFQEVLDGIAYTYQAMYETGPHDTTKLEVVYFNLLASARSLLSLIEAR